MSLLGWYPLIDNYENKGLGGDIFNLIQCSTLATPSFNTGGKIGSKCFCTNVTSASNGKASNVHTVNMEFPNSNLSFGCWFKRLVDGGDNREQIMELGGSDTNGGIGIRIRNSKLCLILNKSGSYDISESLSLNVWYHVFVTLSATGKATVYLNGFPIYSRNKTASFVSSSSLVIGSLNPSSYYNFMGSINDARYYDHCLSPKEVHEIAQGLVLHYPLNNIGGRVGNENYFKDSATGKSYKSNASSTYTDMRMYLDSSFWTDYGTSSNTYTVSFDWELSTPINKDCTVAVYWGQSPYTRLGDLILPANTTSGHYTYTKVWTRSSTFTPSNVFLRLGSTSGTSWLAENPGITFLCFNYKLEINNKETPWCPNVADPEYAALGYNSNVVSDCSGYGNDGTANNVAFSSDSVIFNGSSTFNGTNSYITVNNKAGKVTDEITVSCWAYSANWLHNFRLLSCTQSGGWNFQQTNTSGNLSLMAVFYVNGAYKCSKPVTSLTAGWHHFVSVWDGYKSVLYVDGENKGNDTAALTTKTPITYADNYIQIGAESGGNTTTPASGSYFNGRISDVRIYGKAFTDSDVKALYQQGASIDNLGSMHTYGEFNEGQEKISIGKNKVVSEGSVNEEGNKTSFHSDSTLVTKEINEE